MYFISKFYFCFMLEMFFFFKGKRYFYFYVFVPHVREHLNISYREARSEVSLFYAVLNQELCPVVVCSHYKWLWTTIYFLSMLNSFVYCVLTTANTQSLLIATDVAARGLDIPDVQHVVHYQVPRTTEVIIYVHRWHMWIDRGSIQWMSNFRFILTRLSLL